MGGKTSDCRLFLKLWGQRQCCQLDLIFWGLLLTDVFYSNFTFAAESLRKDPVFCCCFCLFTVFSIWITLLFVEDLLSWDQILPQWPVNFWVGFDFLGTVANRCVTLALHLQMKAWGRSLLWTLWEPSAALGARWRTFPHCTVGTLGSHCSRKPLICFVGGTQGLKNWFPCTYHVETLKGLHEQPRRCIGFGLVLLPFSWLEVVKVSTPPPTPPPPASSPLMSSHPTSIQCRILLHLLSCLDSVGLDSTGCWWCMHVLWFWYWIIYII